jgi:hypothetical protein
VKGLKHISDIRANHDWRPTTSGFQFLPRRKGSLTLCFHNFEREISQSLRAPLGALLGERRFLIQDRYSHSINGGPDKALTATLNT